MLNLTYKLWYFWILILNFQIHSGDNFQDPDTNRDACLFKMPTRVHRSNSRCADITQKRAASYQKMTAFWLEYIAEQRKNTGSYFKNLKNKSRDELRKIFTDTLVPRLKLKTAAEQQKFFDLYLAEFERHHTVENAEKA